MEFERLVDDTSMELELLVENMSMELEEVVVDELPAELE